ncbi:MAG: hypothetical protein CMD15_03285 [Flavobacteriales bacterium]|nr:hypothetical protein [Flavobacteriales bacterium]|tara:strand:- start:37189 stop:38622 length:1434 start_codon:yes stop_codon:yes gene_type:complete
MRNIILALIFLLNILTINAQNEIDALRYSMTDLSGSARYTAMGGAFGALGGEFSSLSSNPAGLGMYQFSELSFTPIINLNSTKSYYSNSTATAYRSNSTVGNFGLVLSTPKNNSDWKRINIGIGWNQLSDFNNSIIIEGVNFNNSIVDKIIELTNGTLTNDLINGNSNTYSQLAWNTYLIDPLYINNELVDGQYVSNFSNNSKIQRKNIRTNGDMSEFVISLGSSFQEKLYVGATLGIPAINFYEYSEYTESENADTANNLRETVLTEEISAYGTGYNFKIGAIYRFTENIKIGAALHTPTFINIEEDYNITMATSFKDSSLSYSMGYRAPFNYDLITPMKAIISASTIFNNIIISGQYELIDYSTAEYFTTGFEMENNTIADIYQRTENIKIGAEINLKTLVLRAGYAKYGSPYVENDFSIENFTYGIGVNNGRYFMDLAYILSQNTNEYSIYSYVNPIKLVNTNHSIVFTLGFRY